jgi:ABC-2 type transport system permease protein
LRKVWTVAHREFVAGVKTKTFIIGLVLMPLMMSAGIIVQRLTRDIRDVTDRRFVIIDHSPQATLGNALLEQARLRNQRELNDPQTGKQVRPRFELELTPAPPTTEELQSLRLELSQQIRAGKLYGYFEIGRDVVLPKLEMPTTAGVDPTINLDDPSLRERLVRAAETNLVRYVTDRATDMEPQMWAQRKLYELVLQRRAIAAGMASEKVSSLMFPLIVAPAGLSERDATTGEIREEKPANQLAAFAVPFGLVMLMFAVVVIAGTPLTQGLVEEKQQRIAEVLLASARPFDLMLGKLLGIAAVSVLLMVIYLGGAYYAAREFGFSEYLPPTLLFWFVLFTVLCVLMYGAIFIAIGAACTQAKEIQNLFTPIMLVLVLPIMVMPNIIQSPTGPLATAMTFIPTAAPMVTPARLALNPAPPVWELLVAVSLSIAATLAFVWAAGRIFRVGMLVQGKGARFSDLFRWLVRG